MPCPSRTRAVTVDFRLYILRTNADGIKDFLAVYPAGLYILENLTYLSHY